MNQAIEDLKKIAEALDFQLIVAESCNVKSVSITTEHCYALYAIVTGLIKNYTERKENGTH